MCRLVAIQTNAGKTIKVADIKSETIKKILEIAPACSKIDYYDILQFNSIDSIRNCKDAVCSDVLTKGKLVYIREGA